MNKGGGEKARAAREGGRGGGRVVPARPKKGAPKVPTPAPSGALQILNVRVAVPGEPPPLPPRRAAPPRDFAAADADEARDPSSLKGWRGLGDGGGFDGLGVVPGAASRLAKMQRAAEASPELLHMPDEKQDAVSELLRNLRPLEPVREDAAEREADAARAARADAALTAPSRVDAPAEGLRLDGAETRDAKGPNPSRSVSRLGRASADAVLDRLALHEAHAVTLGARAAKEAFHRDEQARVRREKADRRESVVRRLTNAGFGEARAREAAARCPERDGAFDFRELRSELESDEALTHAQRRDRLANARRAATETRLAECVEWLCVFAPREEIPESFRSLAAAEGPSASLRAARSRVEDARDAAAAAARDQTRQTTVSGATGTAGAAADAAAEDRAALAGTAAREDPHVALLQRAMLARLGAYGFTRAESRAALERTGWTEQDATYALLRTLHPKSDDERERESERGSDAPTESDVTNALSERADEALALESIFEDAFENANENMWTVRVPADDPETWRPCWLEIHFPPGDRYPQTPPLVSVRHPNLPPAIRRSVAAQLAALSCGELRGEPAAFALAEWLREYMPAILDEHGEMDDVAVARRAAAEAEAEAAREAEMTAEAARARGFLAGPTKFERTFAKIEAEREAEREEEGRAKERRAAYLRFLLVSEKSEKSEKRRSAEAGDAGGDAEDETCLETAAADAEATLDPRDPDEDSERSGNENAEKERVSAARDVSGDVSGDVSVPPRVPTSRLNRTEVIETESKSNLGLDARLDRWEAEHARRVKAARRLDFEARLGDGAAVVAPNSARTKEDERREEAVALATAKGRRAKARAEVYERTREELHDLGLGSSSGDFLSRVSSVGGDASDGELSGKKKKNGASWLTKHVAALGLGDDEADPSSHGTVTELDETTEPDETTDAAARALASGASLLSSRLRESESAAAAAERAALASRRLLDAENAKRRDPKWLKIQETRKTLPAYDMRVVTMELIRTCRASVVSGATGCGKTTQVPQFILEDAIRANAGGECSVVVTQPRRLSAMAVAERVAAERGEAVGQTVGYSIRLESKVSRDTRLLFCTTGILLRRLQSDPDLKGVTHVVVDEVHERDLLSDFLLVILRALASRRSDFRLVAMSATVDAELFQRYFEAEVPGPVRCVEIPGRTFPVAEYRLEDAIEATGYVVDPDGEYAAGSQANADSRSVAGGAKRTFNPLSGGGASGASRAAKVARAAKESAERTSLMDEVTDETRASYPGYSDATLRCLQTVDEEKINLELIEALVAKIADEYEEGAILVFLPGMAEIRGLHERLLAELEDVEKRFVLVPLHSTLSSEEQRLTFSTPPKGVRKVVMATNIAETSITIDDVVFVIDAGRVRETRYDPVTRMSSLVTAWCSRASGRQRRGRAGRVREGYCFHLYSSRKERALADFATPEISRVPLDALCLQIKILKLGDVRAFLKRAIEPPNEAAVDAALRSLQELDAVDTEDELTPLGLHLAELPVDARLGKMMLYGAMFSCLDPVLTIAASTGFRSPFLSPMDRRDEADDAKRRLATGAGATSDHLTLVAAYAGWIRAKARGRAYERDFLSKAFLSAQTLRQISEMRQQYVELLDQIGFLRSGAGLFQRNSGEPVDTVVGETETGEKTNDITSSGLSAAAAPFAPPPPTARRGATNGGAGNKSQTPSGSRDRNGRLAERRAALAAASVNAMNEPLVRAVICAGLYPNVALAESASGASTSEPTKSGSEKANRPMNARDRFAQAAKSSIRTKGDGAVSLHPTSVVFGSPVFAKRFLLFHEKVKTTKVYLRDATLVGAYPLLLFGGKIKVDHARATATCDGWIRFRAAPRVAVLFKNLRKELDATLMRKIADPSLDVDADSAGLVRTIVELLESEETKEAAVVAEPERKRAEDEATEVEREPPANEKEYDATRASPTTNGP